ncbi:MAG: 3-dehydroquinate synthase, partial [Phycisphaerae bacterium]|nr:3-dehydroquinate synthase [Phycisphaerae bacterium]
MLSSAADLERLEIEVPGHRYDFVVGEGIASRLGALVHEVCHGTRRAFVVIDEALADRVGGTIHSSLESAGLLPVLARRKSSEAEKSLAAAEHLWRAMLTAGMDRTTVIVAVGGGVIGDLAAFVAATFMRGVDCVQVPSTLLAMVDASIGGKSAVNVATPNGLVKNVVGVIRQPRRVICDVNLLAGLPDRVFRAGLAECLKHAMIADPELADWMDRRRDAIEGRDAGTLRTLVVRSAKVKATIVSRDERELGERTLLNLGHTFAHALEAVATEAISHGEAVGLGLLAATETSRVAAIWPEADPAKIEARLKSMHLPVEAPQRARLEPLLHAMGL